MLKKQLPIRKSVIFPFSGQSGAKLVSSGIVAQHRQAQVESNEKPSLESIDLGMVDTSNSIQRPKIEKRGL